MSSEFLPSSNRSAEIDIVLSFLSSVIKDRSAIYVSVPITSGLRYLSWVASHPRNRKISGDNQNEEFINSVINHNVQHGRRVVRRVITEFPGRITIDPTAVSDFNGWTQQDYRYAWGKIVEAFCEKVIFTDDWQFSVGCIYEFLTACRNSLVVLNERFEDISISEGKSMISNAIDILRENELKTHFHELVLSEVERVELNPLSNPQ